jgi:transposase
MSENRAPRCEHGTPVKNQLVGAILATGNVAEAARTVNMKYSTARDIWKKYQKHGTTANRPRSGQPRKVTDHTVRQMVRIAMKSRRKPFREIGNEVVPNLAETTVRRLLADEGFHRRVARKVPYLTKAHKRHRLGWARLYRRYQEKQWGRVIWSDEAYVYLGDDRGRVYVTRRSHEEYVQECLVPTFKQSSVRVMVWACIMNGQKGPLVVLEYPGGKGGGMNSSRYQEQVLDGVLRGFYDEMKKTKGSVTFQQDGAPSHTSKLTQRWFSQNEIPLLFHPPSSPDLNPIEPVWHELKTMLRALPHPPNTVNELRDAIRTAWDEMPIEDINKHIKKMPERVEAVSKARGGHTRF